jgi:hypothetical protein
MRRMMSKGTSNVINIILIDRIDREFQVSLLADEWWEAADGGREREAS